MAKLRESVDGEPGPRSCRWEQGRFINNKQLWWVLKPATVGVGSIRNHGLNGGEQNKIMFLFGGIQGTKTDVYKGMGQATHIYDDARLNSIFHRAATLIPRVFVANCVLRHHYFKPT